MRITCPNCDAQYEVEDKLIPETGRDVQCSNCGHGWYQYPAATMLADEDEEAAPAPAPPPAAPAAVVRRAADPRGAAPEATPDEEPPPEPASEPAPAKSRPPLDESLRAILREEAEREAAARAAEAQRRVRAPAPTPVEVQGDLGLPPQPPPTPAKPSEAPAVVAAAIASAKRERLPDVEAINSTLTAGAAPPPAAAPPAPRRGGFVQGFAAVFLVAALLYALYLFAPRIGAAVSVLAGPLEAYVALVDSAHRALVSLLRGGG